MNTAYISGPYTADTQEQIQSNILDAKREAIRWWKQGFGVFCPHMNSATLELEDIPHDLFMKFDLEILRHIDIVVMIGNWDSSIGACIEHVAAKDLGKLIVYRHPLLQYEFYLERNGIRESTSHCHLSLAASMIKEWLNESKTNNPNT